MRWPAYPSALLLLALSAAAADLLQNPPPVRPFSGYASYELKSLEFAPELAANKDTEGAVAQLRTNVDARLAPVVGHWNELVQQSASPETPQIVPRIVRLRYSSSEKRWAAGAFSGKSEVVLTITFVESPGNTVVAEPAFYQSAAAMSGAWTFGGADNAMLGRVVRIAEEYLNANFGQAVGGRTGRSR